MKSEPKSIAYLEDDSEQGHAIATWLSNQGMQCSVFNTTDKIISALADTQFDAIILDVELYGEMAGIEVLKHIRQTTDADLPVLMVSARPYWQAALHSGANDFLEKPLSKEKLIVHLQRLLRPINSDNPSASYYPFEINTQLDQINADGEPIDLTYSEYSLASLLLMHFGKILSYETLVDHLSGISAPSSTMAIEKDMHRLKKKMNLGGGERWELEFIHRYGIRLVNTHYDATVL